MMDKVTRELEIIFDKHKNEKICVIGTTCCGKSTLIKKFPNAIDMDDIDITTEEEDEILNKIPWTEDIGKLHDNIIHERVIVKQGEPVFGTSIPECDIIVYLNIADDILQNHCSKRGVAFDDAKNMKKSIEEKIRVASLYKETYLLEIIE